MCGVTAAALLVSSHHTATYKASLGITQLLMRVVRRRNVKALMMDEISTGLDSSTTFQIVKILRNFCHLRDATILLALLQPAPEVRCCGLRCCTVVCCNHNTIWNGLSAHEDTMPHLLCRCTTSSMTSYCCLRAASSSTGRARM